MKACQKINIKNETEYVYTLMREDGARITEQRKLLVASILKQKSPFCAEDLQVKLKKESIDLATIYRSINYFFDLGILSEFDMGDGVLRYEYLAEKAHHHHHVICRKCKKVEPVDFCSVEGLEKLIGKMGYTDIMHKLEFFALCRKCSA